jgi:crotonobetainyl-CoA:carnitine CoA-transferase CaiB-like acyl-CoA transferase
MGLLFEGLKVIDCGSFIAAPAAATILSDFGADVVKIEPPGAGDPYRHLTKLPGHPRSDQNYAWMLGSRNKRSLAVDMGKPEGRTAVQRLASQADVSSPTTPPPFVKSLALATKHCRR